MAPSARAPLHRATALQLESYLDPTLKRELYEMMEGDDGLPGRQNFKNDVRADGQVCLFGRETRARLRPHADPSIHDFPIVLPGAVLTSWAAAKTRIHAIYTNNMYDSLDGVDEDVPAFKLTEDAIWKQVELVQYLYSCSRPSEVARRGESIESILAKFPYETLKKALLQDCHNGTARYINVVTAWKSIVAKHGWEDMEERLSEPHKEQLTNALLERSIKPEEVRDLVLERLSARTPSALLQTLKLHRQLLWTVMRANSAMTARKAKERSDLQLRQYAAPTKFAPTRPVNAGRC